MTVGWNNTEGWDKTPIMYELAKQFNFDAAHTLDRGDLGETSLRVHGHSYRAEVVLRGEVEPASGMIVDLGILDRELAAIRDRLDHHFLDKVPGLAIPTIENLCKFIWDALADGLPGLYSVRVLRDSSRDSATYYGAAIPSASLG